MKHGTDKNCIILLIIMKMKKLIYAKASDLQTKNKNSGFVSFSTINYNLFLLSRIIGKVFELNIILSMLCSNTKL